MNGKVARKIDGQLRYPSAEIVQAALPPVRGFGTGFAPLASGVFASQKRARFCSRWSQKAARQRAVPELIKENADERKEMWKTTQPEQKNHSSWGQVE